MPSLINWKICDNSKDCSGITACPVGAFYWDEKEKKLTIDNSKCISCGQCEAICPVGAIRFARDEEEFARIQKEIEADTRKVSDLFVDRYGAEPVDPAFLIPEGKFSIQILEATQLAVVEFFDYPTIKCMLHSIPIKSLFGNVTVKYRKIRAPLGSELAKKYGIKELPCLAFFENGKLKGKIEGYREDKEIGKVKEEIGKILGS